MYTVQYTIYIVHFDNASSALHKDTSCPYYPPSPRLDSVRITRPSPRLDSSRTATSDTVSRWC